MNFVFEKSDSITFLMWSRRPYPGPTPTPSNVLPTEISQSRRILLKSQTWDFNTNRLAESSGVDQAARQIPCEQDCPLEVVALAPDNSWQLLQITDAPAESQGFWLVDDDTVAHVIPYVPFDPQWRWSEDSRRLWLVYTLHDRIGESYGAESLIVDLTASEAPKIIFQSWNSSQKEVANLLSPEEYKLVFSPLEKSVLSYKSISLSESSPPDNQLDVYRIDVSQDTPQILGVYKAHFPFLIDWSEALKDFVVLELNSSGAILYALNHEIVYEIPMAVIKQMPQLVGVDNQIRTDFASEVDMRTLYTILERVAIAPDLQHIVLMDGGRAWAFSCPN